MAHWNPSGIPIYATFLGASIQMYRFRREHGLAKARPDTWSTHGEKNRDVRFPERINERGLMRSNYKHQPPPMIPINLFSFNNNVKAQYIEQLKQWSLKAERA
jgi:hypothetical protein